ncbi:tyrosinase family protein [Aquimarina sp. BL5]|uniref:tyrosinase family protein n=1 Tax=Aquimarina sp. BL5 TaxID=1714860 RepID=UPI000E51E550|nr:tyrosinase family protein [Aquimarina sp. BL5]AXT52352.1 tyrosinase family protein [Aquimarina sp. BL5]RKN06591.1 tyrosinase family protein [Aquimarina sp. BL5]
MAGKKKRKSQYEQVKEILNTLQGKAIPSYQGLHAFWLNPKTFMTASLYGQRLIAPKDGSNSNQTSDGCCGSKGISSVPTAAKQPTTSSEGCCGSQKNSSDTASMQPAVSAVQQPPTTTSIGDCWPSGGSGGGGGSSPSQKRSDQSAIIIGLKGHYPFDGSIFPKLLWDASATASADQIQTITNWIDADCPLTLEEEQKNASKVLQASTSNNHLALANGELLHQVSTNKTNQDHKDNKGLTIRKEVSSLTPEELNTFREALNCMFQYTDFWQDERSFDYWARIHTDSCQHGWEQFTTWHRLYLYFFEQKLQDYDQNIALPYWSWTDYADQNKNTFNNKEYDLGVLPEAYGCYLTQKGLDKLKDKKTSEGKSILTKKEISALEKIVKKGTIYNSGLRFLKAAGIPYEIINVNNVAVWSDKIRAIYDILKETNPLWFPNRWPGSMGPLSQYPTKDDINLLLSMDNFGDFGGGPSYDHHYGALEKVHNGMHNFSGGTNPCYPDNSDEWKKIYQKLKLTADPQSKENPVYGWMTDNRITAFDPLFWAHHSNVDRLWARWQELHTGTPQEMNAVLAPWSMTVQDTINIQKLGYTYMRDSVFYDVSSKVGLVKFNSAPTKVSTNTLDTHRKAEIKIHRVQRGNLQNAHIRVFLNAPDATIDTPTKGNDHFVEEISTFHGSCYGGPGHCNLPLDKTRQFDFRQLHHHEPRNYKINATDAVQRILNNGAKDITIQLVILGIDGKQIDNAVYIDGVSLNFMD